MDADYPAAHSMDTCWFAVDMDGRVGFFQTGEAGACPTRGLVGEPAEEARLRLAREVPAGQFEVDLSGRLLPHDRDGWMRHAGGAEFPVLMFLDSLDPVQNALAGGRATEVKARDGFAVLWRALTEAEYRRLHRGTPAACRACFWQLAPVLEGAAQDFLPNPARHGVFVFSALGGNAAANPYGVQLIPSRPVHVDQLPPDLRANLKAVQFDVVSFDHTPVFQPAEHVPCTAYSPEYIDLKGRRHALPDWDADDVSEAEQYRQWRAAREAQDAGDPPPG